MENKINWELFKVEAKGKHLENAKEGFTDFVLKADEVCFYLDSDYTSTMNKVTLRYKLDKNIKIETTSNRFKSQTYKRLKGVIDNPYGDKFIRISEVEVSNKGQNLIVELQENLFNTKFEISLGSYNNFVKSRETTYKYCIENNITVLSVYLGDGEKILVDFNCLHTPHWITPNHLKQGQRCNQCKNSKGEKKIINWCENNNLEYETQKDYFGLKDIKPLRYDVYIPSLNWLIEYDGKQHFEPQDFAGKGEEWAINNFKDTQKKDNMKNSFAKYSSDYFTRIPYTDFDNIEQILDDKLKEILEYRQTFNEALEEAREHIEAETDYHDFKNYLYSFFE